MSGRNFPLKDQLVILCRSVNTNSGSKDLNKAPALTGVLMDLLLISVTCLALDRCPAFAEPDELVLVSGVISRLHEASLDHIWIDVDYKSTAALELARGNGNTGHGTT